MGGGGTFGAQILPQKIDKLSLLESWNNELPETLSPESYAKALYKSALYCTHYTDHIHILCMLI